jgi:TonB-dependent SusC/RagA subfamily outer membrane receptor
MILRRMAPFAALLLALLPLRLAAQVTVMGSVTVNDQPVRGATVEIPDLRLNTRTNEQGDYSFIIRAAMVRGQSVTIVARHSRYGSRSASIVLSGGAIQQDFALAPVERPTVTESAPAALPLRRPMGSRMLDSMALLGDVGSLDLASAIAGRIPGLLASSATENGSSRLTFRGLRTVAGASQPLVVVDGMTVDNIGATTVLQRFGLGGFDYGTPLNDIALDDIASITLLSGADAVALYGARAANGVLQITTKGAGVAQRLQLSTFVRYAGQSPLVLPAFQNRYGQGLNGAYEFFDGQGGGINDGVAESWGPALDGQLITQNSYTEPRRPVVRYWLPRGDIADYYQSGRSVDANVALVGARRWMSGRAALNARDVNGLSPGAGVRRLGTTLSALAQPSSRFTARGNLRVVSTTADQRPGTGFDEVNPVSGFTRLARQIDLDSLRTPLQGTEQINWIYTATNNPFFQSLENSNQDTRTHVLGSADFTYNIRSGWSATAALGLADVDESRTVSVADGWKGTYPTALGRRDFSSGGDEQRTVGTGDRTLRLGLAMAPRRVSGFSVAGGAGVEKRRQSFRSRTTIVDTAAVDSTESSAFDVTAFYLAGTVARTSDLSLDAALRVEQSSASSPSLRYALFPTLAVSYDAARVIGRRAGIGDARIRVSWWQAGAELTPRAVREVFAGGGTPTSPTTGIGIEVPTLPERTRGIEMSAELESTNRRFGLDLTLYDEASREVFVANPIALGHLASLSNRGVEGQMRANPHGDPAARSGTSWQVSASFARNSSRVGELADSVGDIALSPSFWGTTLVAREGQPFGAILGKRYLRDSATKALVLRNGLPLADTGVTVLGSVQPDWSAALSNQFRVGSFELSLLFDARMGGRVFSATNLWGSYAGNLEETLAGRETGLRINGIDSVTRAANTDTVTAQDYFHALGAISEPWVYDASFWKLREARLTYSLPLSFVPAFRDYTARVAFIGRNLATWAKAPNIDPESALSAGPFQGFEMGQLPGTRTLGIMLSLSP